MAPAYAAARTRHYHDTGSAVISADANPHRLISMLYDGVLERLAKARAGILRSDVQAKLQSINGAMAILEYLRTVLDHKAGGEMAGRLDSLYEYMQRRLAQANAVNDSDALREVGELIITIKSGWDEIAGKVA